MSFECPDCTVTKPNGEKYIWRFHDERTLGALGRERRRTEHSEGDSIRCVPCHSLKGRLTRVMTVEDRGDWAQVGKQEKAAFMQNSADKFGQGLKTAVSVTIRESTVNTQMTSFTSTGGFVDLEDITKKYENKPEQLKNILDNAPRMNCPVRKVVLFQDPEYALKQVNEEQTRREMQRTAQHDCTVKAAKKG